MVSARTSTLFSGRTIASFVALAAAGVSLSGCIGVGWESAEYTQTRTVSVAHVAGKGLDVQTANGSIAVARGEASEVSIIAKLRATTQERLDATVVDASRDGDGTLVVRVVWPGKRKGSEGCSFEITVPDAAGVELESSNGALSVTGLAGDAVLDTSNGQITVTDHDGKVRAETSNGAIVVRSCTGAVHAESSNGKVVLTEVGAPVFADTSNGGVTLVMRADARGPINVSSSNGPIDVTLSPLFTGGLSADTSHGSVTCSSLTGASLTTVSRGKVRLRFGAAAAGSGDVEASSGQDESRVDTSNGSITIRSRSGV